MRSPGEAYELSLIHIYHNYLGEAMPATRDLISALRDAGHAAVVSGAGPSVLVLAGDPGERIAAAAIAQAQPGGWTPHYLAVDIKGATVEEVSA